MHGIDILRGLWLADMPLNYACKTGLDDKAAVVAV